MKKKFLFKFILLALVGLPFGFSSHAAETVKLYAESSDTFPFAMKDKTGVDYIVLNLIEKKLGIKFEYTLVPWERCLATMKSGEADGCFTGSFKKERQEMGVYPMNGETPDPNKQLHTSSYSLFVPTGKTSSIKVDGMNISGIAKGGSEKIGTVLGYSIADDLTKLGYSVDSQAPSTETNFKKLLAGRLAAVATLTPEGEYLLSLPQYKDKIAMIPQFLVEKNYYLMLSKQFVEKHKDLAEKIWSTIPEVRNSPEYKAAVSKYMAEKK